MSHYLCCMEEGTEDQSRMERTREGISTDEQGAWRILSLTLLGAFLRKWRPCFSSVEVSP